MAKKTSTRAKKAPRRQKRLGLLEWRELCEQFRDVVAKCRDASDPIQRATEEPEGRSLWPKLMPEIRRLSDALTEDEGDRDAHDRTSTFYGVWDSQNTAGAVWVKAQCGGSEKIRGNRELAEGLSAEDLSAREAASMRRMRLHRAKLGLDREYEGAVLARYLLRYHEHHDPQNAVIANPEDGGRTVILVAERAVKAKFPDIDREYHELVGHHIDQMRALAESLPEGDRERVNLLKAADRRDALHRRIADMLDAGDVDAVKAAYVPEELGNVAVGGPLRQSQEGTPAISSRAMDLWEWLEGFRKEIGKQPTYDDADNGYRKPRRKVSFGAVGMKRKTIARCARELRKAGYDVPPRWGKPDKRK